MGKFKCNKELFNIKDICEEVIDLQRLNADVKDIQLNLKINLKNLMIYNDPNRLK